jgi:hypothetical protein
MSNSTHTPSSGSPFSFNEFNNLVAGVEMLYALARRLSLAVQNQTCEYLIQEAAMAFTKTMLSLLGFLRFLPSSFYAKEGEFVIDISSASVMARQVMEDTTPSFICPSEDSQENKRSSAKLSGVITVQGKRSDRPASVTNHIHICPPRMQNSNRLNNISPNLKHVRC